MRPSLWHFLESTQLKSVRTAAWPKPPGPENLFNRPMSQRNDSDAEGSWSRHRPISLHFQRKRADSGVQLV